MRLGRRRDAGRGNARGAAGFLVLYGGDEFAEKRGAGELGLVSYVEFDAYAFHVRVDGVLAYPQAGRDLAVRPALGDLAENLLLAF